MYPLLSREGLGMPALVMQALYTLVAYECGLLSPNSAVNKLTAGPEEVTYFFAKFAKIKRIAIAVRTLHLPSSTHFLEDWHTTLSSLFPENVCVRFVCAALAAGHAGDPGAGADTPPSVPIPPPVPTPFLRFQCR